MLIDGSMGFKECTPVVFAPSLGSFSLAALSMDPLANFTSLLHIVQTTDRRDPHYPPGGGGFFPPALRDTEVSVSLLLSREREREREREWLTSATCVAGRYGC